MMLKKNDFLLILSLLALSCVPLFMLSDKESNLYAHITVNGRCERIIALTPEQNETFSITTSTGYNSIHLQNGAISVHDADCHDQICVKSGSISQSGEIIACLPHKLLIEIRSSER